MPATTTSAPGTLDHVKHLAITVPINVSSTGRKLSYAVCMSAKMILPSELPYNAINPLDDLRLGSCTANLIDFGTMVVADLFLTNTGMEVHLGLCRGLPRSPCPHQTHTHTYTHKEMDSYI
ncbi:hypothetical protein Vretimale_4518 [Volvox reticuliferus]|uniref:Uncharacterized protein n=1 Tax=Volvox reticuliferus TaxID=1737510 RepID=A0A8J4DE40_9CHLO|nr:hypothetical protein Vretimale_4518 [Volvox reticuliferus]